MNRNKIISDHVSFLEETIIERFEDINGFNDQISHLMNRIKSKADSIEELKVLINILNGCLNES